MTVPYCKVVLTTSLLFFVSISRAATVSDSTKSDSPARFNQAIKYFNAANYHGAAKIFNELDHGRSYPLLNYYVGVCSYETGNYKNALNFLSTLGPNDSLYAMASYYQAETIIALLNPSAAVDYLKNSLSKDSTFSLAKIELIKTLCNLNRFDDAEDFVKKQNNESDAMTLCQCLLVAMKYQDAYPFLSEWVTRDSTNAMAKIMLAEIYYETQKYSFAANEYSSILETFGQSPPIIRKISLCYGHMSGKANLEIAVNMMKRYFKLAADSSSEDLENIGKWYFDLSKFDLAKIYFQAAVKQDSLNPSAYLDLGLTFLKLEKIKEAEDNLSRAYSLSQNGMLFSISVLKSLAAAELRNKNCADAIRNYKKILGIFPDDAEAVYGLGLAYDQSNQFKEAALWYRKFVVMKGGGETNKSFKEYAVRRLKEISGNGK